MVSSAAKNACRTVLTVAWLFASLVTAGADDWYVDNVSGIDRAAGNVADQPLKSIQAALDRSRPGDRIILKKSSEPYREQLSINGARNSGLDNRPLEIVGNGATLEGADRIRGTIWEALGNDLFQFRPNRLSHQVLFLNGRPLEKVDSALGEPLPDLKPLQWTQRDGWIIVRTEPGRAPYQYEFACCRRTVGITLFQAHDVLISDLVIQGFQLDGVNVHDLADGITIQGCVIRGNGRSGVSVGGASRATIGSCLIGDNGDAQVRTEGYCRLEIDSCDILEQVGRIPIDHQGGAVVRDGNSNRP